MERLVITDGLGDELSLSDLPDCTWYQKNLLISCVEKIEGQTVQTTICPTDEQWEQIRRYIDNYLMDKQIRRLENADSGTGQE